MEKMLARHGFTNVIMYKGGTENYPVCLRYSAYNVLMQNLDEPVLVLEDDIVFHKNPSFVYNIPDDSAAVYFGTAGTCMDFEGTGRNRSLEKKDYEIVDDTFIRVKNMLAAHAILYLGKAYKQALGGAFLTSNMPCDVEMCKAQPLFKVYGLRIPLCWQSSRFNTDEWTEHVTKVRFNERGCWTYTEGEDDEEA